MKPMLQGYNIFSAIGCVCTSWSSFHLIIVIHIESLMLWLSKFTFFSRTFTVLFCSHWILAEYSTSTKRLRQPHELYCAFHNPKLISVTNLVYASDTAFSIRESLIFLLNIHISKHSWKYVSKKNSFRLMKLSRIYLWCMNYGRIFIIHIRYCNLPLWWNTFAEIRVLRIRTWIHTIALYATCVSCIHSGLERILIGNQTLM